MALGRVMFVFLLVVLVGVDKSICRQSFSLPLPRTKNAQMPKSVFSTLRNLTSTEDFLKTMKMYQNEKKRAALPSQVKTAAKLKSRNSGGPALREDLVDLDIQECKIVPYVHFLDQPAPSENAYIWPFNVKLPRCEGSCNVRRDIVSCRMETKVDIPLTAYYVPYHASRKRRDVMAEIAKWKDPIKELRKKRSSPGFQILTVKLEAHTSCECQCTKTNDTCAKENKVLNKAFCQCECPSVQTCKLPLEWDSNQCKCVCGVSHQDQRRTCRNKYPAKYKRMHFDEQKCACQCKYCPSTVAKYNVVDIKTCDCKCAVKSCPANEVLAHRKKMCACRRKRG